MKAADSVAKVEIDQAAFRRVVKQVMALQDKGLLEASLRRAASKATAETRAKTDKLLAAEYGLKLKDVKSVMPVRIVSGADSAAGWARFEYKAYGTNIGRLVNIKAGAKKRIEVAAHQRLAAAIKAYKQKHRVGVKATGKGKDLLSKNFSAAEISKMFVSPRTGMVFHGEEARGDWYKPVTIEFGQLGAGSALEELREYAKDRLVKNIRARLRRDYAVMRDAAKA